MSKDRDLRSSLVKHETAAYPDFGLVFPHQDGTLYQYVTNDAQSRRLNAISPRWL